MILWLGQLGRRAELMLDLVVDIKNNRKRGGDESISELSRVVMKWLTKCGIKQIHLGSLTWDDLIQRDKKGTSLHIHC